MNKLVFSCFLLFSFSILQAQWQYTNPKPTGFSSVDLHFFDTEKGILLQNKELFLSNDGGNSWQKSQDLLAGQAMDFMNGNGWVVAGGFDLLYTQDNGVSWMPIRSPEIVKDVSMVDNKTAIFTMENNLLKTSDGGLTWVEISTNQTRTITDLHFNSEQIGFFATNNGEVYKTVDGGNNWTQNKLSGREIIELYFVNDSIGFIGEQFRNTYRTIDGGDSWQEVNIDIDPTGFNFVNDKVGYAFSDNGFIRKTVNGGVNWTNANLERTIEPFGISGAYFFTEQEGFVVDYHGHFHKTMDGGRNWTIQSLFALRGRALAFPSDSIGFAVGSEIWKSTDGGDNWQKLLSNPYDNNTSYFSVQFLSEEIGYIGGEDATILKTTDGGEAWIKLTFDIFVDRNALMLRLFFLDENIGFVAVSNGNSSTGNLLKTVDGGKTWQSQSSQRLSSLYFQDEQNGIGIDPSGRCFLTSDSGITWEQILEDYTNDLIMLDFPSDSVGYILGEGQFFNNLVLKTVDGGQTWTETEIDIAGSPITFTFWDENSGIIGNSYGNYTTTKDGGQTWEVEQAFNFFEPNCLAETPNGKIISIADYGKILINSTLFAPISTPLEPKIHAVNPLNIFPNPVVDRLYFSNTPYITFLKIYDITGKVLLTQNELNVTSVDLSSLTEGLYFLSVSTKDGRVSSLPFIKQ